MTLQQAYSKLDSYKKSKLAPGGFLLAVLENDLTTSVLKADKESQQILTEITKYCWQTLPHNIWGSPQKVKEHLQGQKQKITPHNILMDIEIKKS
jgi:hypothetical protein